MNPRNKDELTSLIIKNTLPYLKHKIKALEKELEKKVKAKSSSVSAVRSDLEDAKYAKKYIDEKIGYKYDGENLSAFAVTKLLNFILNDNPDKALRERVVLAIIQAPAKFVAYSYNEALTTQSLEKLAYLKRSPEQYQVAKTFDRIKKFFNPNDFRDEINALKDHRDEDGILDTGLPVIIEVLQTIVYNDYVKQLANQHQELKSLPNKANAQQRDQAKTSKATSDGKSASKQPSPSMLFPPAAPSKTTAAQQPPSHKDRKDFKHPKSGPH